MNRKTYCFELRNNKFEKWFYKHLIFKTIQIGQNFLYFKGFFKN
ncbi:hypothetical protein HMPREF0653_00947 [Prevotella disiens JCM 6334 = ATCC 29426]|uniref:Uncharacterized protein n=1 Tax=Prevotella disiens JCM 6334 = ATCC 29426 TaxID=1235811 RepID=A0ABN0NTC2_9BACT|nr:hypothetical protein HMPREF0653_00947 [Prevotella disiens JCM 6334 = ATCC 29426]